jgi:hypothetical protein
LTVSRNCESLIISRKTAENQQAGFYIKYEQKTEENSFTDWTVKSSNSENIRNFAEYRTTQEIQNDRRKYARFGPGYPVMRAFRTEHIKKSIISGD